MSDNPGPYPEHESVLFDMADVMQAIKEHAKSGKLRDTYRAAFGIREDGTDEPLSDKDGEATSTRAGLPPLGVEVAAPVATTPFTAAPPVATAPPAPTTPSATAPPVATAPRAPVRADNTAEETKRGRKHKKTADLTSAKWQSKTLDGWNRLNGKILAEALKDENIHVIPELNLAALVDRNQERNRVPYPEFETTIPMAADKPLMLVDRNGIPAVIIFPGWLAKRSHDTLFDSLMNFGRRADVQVREAADKNTRDSLDNYTRLDHDEEIHGVFQLVSIWRALGRSAENAPAGPARDFLKNVDNLNSGLDLLHELRVVTLRLMDMFERIDEDQYTLFTEASARLKQLYPAYKRLAAMDPSFLHGRSLIFNRETGWHTDRRDLKLGWTPIITTGKYTEGRLHVLGREIAYLPGTLAFIRGGILKHAVTFQGGQRVAIAHFMHKNVLAEVGAAEVGLKSYREMPGYEGEPVEYESEESM